MELEQLKNRYLLGFISNSLMHGSSHVHSATCSNPLTLTNSINPYSVSTHQLTTFGLVHVEYLASGEGDVDDAVQPRMESGDRGGLHSGVLGSAPASHGCSIRKGAKTLPDNHPEPIHGWRLTVRLNPKHACIDGGFLVDQLDSLERQFFTKRLRQ